MSFATLAVVVLAGIAGPLLALPARWRLPVLLGELAAGLVLGRTGVGYLDPDEPTFAFLGQIGFALVMFVAGSHVPVRSPGVRATLRPAVLRACAVGVVAAIAGSVLAALFGTGHGALYAVLMASSSAAVVIPAAQSLQLPETPALVGGLAQIAIADAACVVALPLVIDPAHAARAALGSVAVLAVAAVAFGLLHRIEHNGWRRRVHRLSEDRRFAVELRVSLAVLFGLAALAVAVKVSILLAGFSLGLAVAAVGPPRRLARQLFAITEGLFGPLYFVWLGSSLDVRGLADNPRFIVIGVLLGLGAVGCHAALALTGQSLPVGLMASAQLGVPVAAATVGGQLGVLAPGEGPALVLGALITIGVSLAGAAWVARFGPAGPVLPTPAPVPPPAS